VNKTLWFVVPVHGRLPLYAICLRQLRRTCDALTENGVTASAVVVADKPNLRELKRKTRGLFGFGTIVRDNTFLSRRFNDGIQLACDPAYNPRPVDYVVPCGSDDWVDYRILLNLPPAGMILGFQNIAFVREDGREMTTRFLNYQGGCGIRVYPRDVLEKVGYRPADEDRERACDTSILTNLVRNVPHVRVAHKTTDPRQIVDWKTAGTQLNSYDALRRHRSRDTTSDPFLELADIYPGEALEEMRAHYRQAVELIA